MTEAKERNEGGKGAGGGGRGAVKALEKDGCQGGVTRSNLVEADGDEEGAGQTTCLSFILAISLLGIHPKELQQVLESHS